MASCTPPMPGGVAPSAGAFARPAWTVQSRQTLAKTTRTNGSFIVLRSLSRAVGQLPLPRPENDLPLTDEGAAVPLSRQRRAVRRSPLSVQVKNAKSRPSRSHRDLRALSVPRPRQIRKFSLRDGKFSRSRRGGTPKLTHSGAILKPWPHRPRPAAALVRMVQRAGTRPSKRRRDRRGDRAPAGRSHSLELPAALPTSRSLASVSSPPPDV